MPVTLFLLRVLQDNGQFDGAPIASFLLALGMSKFSSSFAEAEVDLEALQMLDDQDLKDIGVSVPDEREKLLQGVAELRSALGDAVEWLAP